MKLLVDTSVLHDVGAFQRLAAAAAARSHRLLVPTLVWTERDAQVRRRVLGSYNPAVVADFYARFEQVVELLPWDELEGAQAAQRLASRFPTEAAWQDAKRAAAARALNVPDPGPNRRCGAQLDWYLAASASPDRPIVTAERTDRDEWSGWEAGSVLTVQAAIDLMATS